MANIKLDCKNFAYSNALASLIFTNRARAHKVVADIRSRSALVANIKLDCKNFSCRNDLTYLMLSYKVRAQWVEQT